jgi:hypothetical protein
MNNAENWIAENLLRPIGNVLGLKGVGNRALSKATGAPTVGQATRQSAVGGASYQAKNEYIYTPGLNAVDNFIKGKKPGGLSADVVDQLDAALG